MGTSHSEPEDTGGFVRAARDLTRDKLQPANIRGWSVEGVTRLLDHFYDLIRNELMSGDQEVLRKNISVFSQIVTMTELGEKSYEGARITTLRALFMRNARKYETAKILSTEVLVNAREQGWNDLAYDALITLGDVGVQQGAVQSAREYYIDALSVAERRSDEIGAARALLNRSALDQATGRPREAATAGTEAFQRFLDAGSSKLAGWALLQESQAHSILGDYAQAFDTADRARNLFEVMNSMQGLAVAWVFIGISHHLRTDLISALQAYEKAHELVTKYDLGDADTVDLQTAILKLDLGKLDDGHQELKRLSERLSKSGRLPHLFVVNAALVSWAAMAGEFDELEDYLTRAEILATRTGIYEVFIVRQLELARKALTDQHSDQAEAIERLETSQREGLLGEDID